MYLLAFTSLWPPIFGVLALVLLLSGLDDLVPGLICLWRLTIRKQPEPKLRTPASISPRRIAIFVPCWKEAGVIGDMIRHNLAAISYPAFDFFLGVYPNDGATVAVVRQLSAAFPNVHVAMCPNPGPTSKADCLNWVYQRMLSYEEETGFHFDTVVLHDAEDLIHPDALPTIDHERHRYDMVQVPVLPLATSPLEFTHGIYCDDFAEYQMVDMRARQFCRSFIPSNGVGTGFARKILDRLAAERNQLVFNPASLTEDYEIGVYVHSAGYAQLFAPLRSGRHGLIATREYFPRRVRSAIRQRTRWVTGIALQSWARDGWRGSWRSKYWFWRDRKGLVANPISLLTNLLFLAGLIDWLLAGIEHRPWMFAVPDPRVIALCWATSLMQCLRLGLRMFYTGRIYGAGVASLAPLRAFYGNFINCCASLGAMWRFAQATINGSALVWLKTEHAYPSRVALAPEKRELTEILVSSGFLSEAKMHEAKTELSSEAYLAEFLTKRGLISEDELCRAISAQSGVPLTRVDVNRVKRKTLRCLPVHIGQRFGLVPFWIENGRIFVAGARVPSPDVYEQLQRFTQLPVEFHLVTKRNYEELRALL